MNQSDVIRIPMPLIHQRLIIDRLIEGEGIVVVDELKNEFEKHSRYADFSIIPRDISSGQMFSIGFTDMDNGKTITKSGFTYPFILEVIGQIYGLAFLPKEHYPDWFLKGESAVLFVSLIGEKAGIVFQHHVCGITSLELRFLSNIPNKGKILNILPA